MKHLCRTMPIVAALLAGGMASAQSDVSAAGGTTSGQGYEMSYTLGQAMVAGVAGMTHSLFAGVQQPAVYATSAIDNAGAAASDVALFPNPVTGVATLSRTGGHNGSCRVALHTPEGREVRSWWWNETTMTVDMTTLPAGLYLLVVSYENNNSEIIKIVKQ